MKPLLPTILLCFMVVSLLAAEPTNPHLFQLRLVLDKATPDSERMTMVSQTSGGQSVRVVLNVAKGALLDEADVKAARSQSDPLSGRPQVAIIFTKPGQRAFAEITRTNVNKQLAILIDGKVVEAPMIRTEIKDGEALVAGNFTPQQAEDLVQRINKAVEGKQDGKMKPWPYGPHDGLKVTPR